MSLRFLFPCLALSVPFFALACSSAASDAGLDESAKVSTLSAAEQTDLCDWASTQYGGYGKEKSCNGASAKGPASQKECVDGIVVLTDSCAATVGDYQTITKSLASCNAESGFQEAFARFLSCASVTPTTGLGASSLLGAP